MTQFGNQFGPHFSDPRQRLVPGVAQVGVKVLTFGAHTNIAFGFGSGRKPHRTQRGRDVQLLAAMGILHPRRRQNLAAFQIDQEKPFLTGLFDALFQIVINVVHIARMVKGEVTKVGLHHGQILMECHAAHDVLQRMRRIVLNPFAALAGQARKARDGVVSIGKKVWVKGFGIGGAFNLLRGNLGRIKTDRAHRVGHVQRLAATRVSQPCALVDAGATEIDQKEPFLFTRRGDAFFDPVINGVDRGRTVEMEIGKIDLHDLQIVKEADPLIQRGDIQVGQCQCYPPPRIAYNGMQLSLAPYFYSTCQAVTLSANSEGALV